MHKKCKICGKPIVLVPSAAERAKKFGGSPSDYIALFETHTNCQLEKNKESLKDLLKRRGDRNPRRKNRYRVRKNSRRVRMKLVKGKLYKKTGKGRWLSWSLAKRKRRR